MLSTLLANACQGGSSDEAARTFGGLSFAPIICSSRTATPDLELVGPFVHAADSLPGLQIHRVTGVVPRPGGGVVFVNASSGEVVAIDQAGDVIGSTGGLGQGPGEYSFPVGIDRYRGDSVVVFDRDLLRATVLDPISGGVRVIPIREPLPNGLMLGAMEDGRLVLTREWMHFDGPAKRDSLHVIILGADGRVIDVPLRLPSSSSFGLEIQGQLRRGTVQLGPQAWVAVGGDRIIGGVSDTPTLTVWSDHDTAATSIPCSSVPVTDEVRSAYVRERVAGYTDRERAREQAGLLRELPFSDSLPLYRRLLFDTATRLVWLGAWGIPAQPDRWLLMSLDGTPAAFVQTPTGFYPFYIHDNTVTGVARDELGLESIESYRADGPVEGPHPR